MKLTDNGNKEPASNFSMRKLCPNLDREDGLETVLEVPIPEELFLGATDCQSNSCKHLAGTTASRLCTNMMAWMRSHLYDPRSAVSMIGGGGAELQLLLGIVGAPLIPFPIRQLHHSCIIGCGMKLEDNPIEASMAKYIVQQYVAAAGGERAVNEISSMYAMGKVRMELLLPASDVGTINGGMSCKHNNNNGNAGGGKKAGKAGRDRGGGGGGEMGGFVLWQKQPELWCLELVVSGCKVSAGSNGKVSWRQTPWQQSSSRGPPRPLRRSLQGLDPKSIANLFTTAVCIGEKTVNNQECFVLRLDAEDSALRSRSSSSSSVEIIRHTVWGYFSQRTALLVHLEDSHLLSIKIPNQESVYWETIMESSINDYRPVDGIQIAHTGRTTVSLFRFGEAGEEGTIMRMEETWTVEEVDFNIWGLSMDCFLPPGDIKMPSILK